MSNVAEWIAAAGWMATPLTVLVSGWVGRRGQQKIADKVDKVHSEVRTSNGITLAVLADRTEGRRIETEIPHDERTTSEQHYVDQLGDPDPGAITQPKGEDP